MHAIIVYLIFAIIFFILLTLSIFFICLIFLIFLISEILFILCFFNFDIKRCNGITLIYSKKILSVSCYDISKTFSLSKRSPFKRLIQLLSNFGVKYNSLSISLGQSKDFVSNKIIKNVLIFIKTCCNYKISFCPLNCPKYFNNSILIQKKSFSSGFFKTNIYFYKIEF